MTESEKSAALGEDIRRLIGRYAAEFDMALSTAVGVLEIAKLELIQWHQTGADEEESE